MLVCVVPSTHRIDEKAELRQRMYPLEWLTPFKASAPAIESLLGSGPRPSYSGIFSVQLFGPYQNLTALKPNRIKQMFHLNCTKQVRSKGFTERDSKVHVLLGCISRDYEQNSVWVTNLPAYTCKHLIRGKKDCHSDNFPEL